MIETMNAMEYSPFIMPKSPEEQIEFHKRTSALGTLLNATLIQCVPQSWRKVELSISVTKTGSSEALHLRLSDPTMGEQVRDIPGSVFHLASALHCLFVEYDPFWNWIRAVVEFQIDGMGRIVEATQNFTYP